MHWVFVLYARLRSRQSHLFLLRVHIAAPDTGVNVEKLWRVGAWHQQACKRVVPSVLRAPRSLGVFRGSPLRLYARRLCHGLEHQA